MSSDPELSRREKRTLRDFVDVRCQPTVVRLEDAAADWVTDGYHVTDDIQKYLDALREALVRKTGLGMFLLGPYGSGKSHFLAYLLRELRVGSFVRPAPHAAAISLVNFPAEMPLERIVARTLEIEGRAGDRGEAWADLERRHPHGLILVIDELSEFLRSKSDVRAFNEDVRFLQFLGEWATGTRLWILAALQEQIEHTGELDHALYRKIKDRFPLRMLLTPQHVRDLLADCILIKKSGYDEAVHQLEREITQALPGLPFDRETLHACYPIHPATLDLLGQVRDRFSQARGAVDFVVTQLAGRPERSVPAFLDRPWGEFLTPEMIVDHFRDLFEIQPEFQSIAQQVFPYYDKALPGLFDLPARRDLAERLLKLLVLVHLSPVHESIGAAEGAAWLVVRASRLEPRKNQDAVQSVLRDLAERGRYVAFEKGRFRLEPKDDGGAVLDRMLEREKNERAGRGEAVLEEIFPHLVHRGVTPLTLARDRWESRAFTWHHHERPLSVFLGQEDPGPPPSGRLALCIKLPWGAAAGAPGVVTVLPEPLEPGPEVIELAALLRLVERPWSPADRKRIESRVRDRQALIESRVRAAYLRAKIVGPAGQEETPRRSDPGAGLAPWLDGYAEWMSRRLYPSFERFAPVAGPLPRRNWIQLMEFALDRDLTEERAPDPVQLVREGYLVPMGLLERRGRGYAVPKALERHELVRLIRPMLDLRPDPKTVYERLAEPVYGLVQDQIHALIVFLLIQGELDLVKGRRSYRDLYPTLPNPLQYDRVEPGRGLAVEELHDLERLCQGFSVRVPSQWTVLAQRRVLQRLIEAGRQRRESLGSFVLRAERLDGAGKIADEARALMAGWTALDRGEEELDGLRAFVSQVGSPARFVARSKRLEELAPRIERLAAEASRLRHLLGQPALAGGDSEFVERFAALGPAPPLAEPDDLEGWLASARTIYEEYKSWYKRLHAEWWESRRAPSALDWSPPAVARSRHLACEEELKVLGELQAQAARQRCRGLVDLDFQALCACGFDGKRAPFGDSLERLEAVRRAIESRLGDFFGEREIRDRVAELVASGGARGSGVESYLAGKKPWPELDETKLLDEQLAGLSIVENVDLALLIQRLCGRTWGRDELRAELDEIIRSWPGRRLRFPPPAEEQRDTLASWCAEQSLRTGRTLPKGWTAAEHAAMSKALRAEWVGRRALARLEDLGLADDALDRVVGWLLDGTLSVPQGGKRSPLVTAVTETITPSEPRSAEELARLAAQFYRQHPRMLRVGGRGWLDRLERLARTRLAQEPPPLHDVLDRWRDAAWVVVDALGAVLHAEVEGELDRLLRKRWRRVATELALAPAVTTTEASYRQLIDAGLVRSFDKIDAIDGLIHDRHVPFGELVRLAKAELSIAFGRLAPRLDPGRPVVVFADHGFRLAADGKSYEHGGSSVLERLVPVVHYAPG